MSKLCRFATHWELRVFRRTLAVIVLLSIAIFSLTMFVLPASERPFGLIALGAIGPIGLLIRRRIDRHGLECLRACNFRICPQCRYDLHAVPERCPECGLAFTEETLKSCWLKQYHAPE